MKVIQSRLTLCDPRDCSRPGSSIHGIFQARILECVAIPFSRGSSHPGMEPRSPTLQTDSLPSESLGKSLEECPTGGWILKKCSVYIQWGFSGVTVAVFSCQCRRLRFDPWVRTMPSRRKWHSHHLAWEIPWTEEPGGLQSMGSKRVRHIHTMDYYQTIKRMDVRVGLWRKLSAEKLMLLNCGVWEDSWVPWTARRSNQSILKEINPGCSLEGLMLKLKLQYFGHLMQKVNSLGKTLMLGGIGGRRRRGRQRMRWLDGITDSMTWVWVSSGSLWWTGRPGVLRFTGSQRAGHDWATELNW